LYISLGASPAFAQTPDALYADRENLASVTQAVALWAAVAHEAPAFEPAWKLARAYYWLGVHGAESDRRHYLDLGITAAGQAVRLSPDRPEGHFWQAANMGALAEDFGLRAGLKYRTPIREALERVLRIDPAFMEGGADRALGRWYFDVPSLFGGSNAKAEEHLRASLRYNEQSTVSHYFLAELFLDENRKTEARAELQRVLDAPLTTDWAPEDRDYKRKASTLLATLR